MRARVACVARTVTATAESSAALRPASRLCFSSKAMARAFRRATESVLSISHYRAKNTHLDREH